MHPITRAFATFRYSLAVLLLTATATTGALSAPASSLPELDGVDGLGFSDGTEAIKKSETLAAEPLAENAWDFEKPDSIPGFSAIVTPDQPVN
jgi:hypothetical protein